MTRVKIKPRLIKTRANHYYGKHHYYAMILFDDYEFNVVKQKIMKLLSANFGPENYWGAEHHHRRWGQRTARRVQLTNCYQTQIGIKHEHDVTLMLLLLSAEGLLEYLDVKIKME